MLFGPAGIIVTVAVVGVVAVVASIINRFNKKTLQKEVASKLNREIKQQIYQYCLELTEQFSNERQRGSSAQLKNIVQKGFKERQKIILDKYQIERDQFISTLQRYKDEEDISKDQEQLDTLLNQVAENGKIKLQIPSDLYNQYNQFQMVTIYHQMLQHISVHICQKLQEKKAKKSTFNPKNIKQFKKALRQLDIYDLKLKFLQAKGFKQEWGCPNIILLKIIWKIKRDNQQARKQLQLMDQTFTEMKEVIRYNFENYDKAKIRSFIHDKIKYQKRSLPGHSIVKIQPQILSKDNDIKELSNQPQPQPQPNAQFFILQESGKNEVKEMKIEIQKQEESQKKQNQEQKQEQKMKKQKVQGREQELELEKDIMKDLEKEKEQEKEKEKEREKEIQKEEFVRKQITMDLSPVMIGYQRKDENNVENPSNIPEDQPVNNQVQQQQRSLTSSSVSSSIISQCPFEFKIVKP